MNETRVRPVIKMAPIDIPWKGAVAAVVENCNDDASFWRVDIWVQSPTGDSSDSMIFTLPCTSHSQAMEISKMWREHWGL